MCVLGFLYSVLISLLLPSKLWLMLFSFRVLLLLSMMVAVAAAATVVVVGFKFVLVGNVSMLLPLDSACVCVCSFAYFFPLIRFYTLMTHERSNNKRYTQEITYQYSSHIHI